MFFDLVFVVAVSISAVELHHALAEDHVLDGVLSYAAVFFSIIPVPIALTAVILAVVVAVLVWRSPVASSREVSEPVV
ncbi:hypothetical protein AYL44_05560 [Microbacterium oleivorans]|uniref:Uncharacterized protein n=1 Tax=Microbacterium oleivorans TaxID=273677 RepID=A0A177KE61_9MICO|nr:hypothetical protein AYL44_05560 [Microbacterium oleivorans]